MKVTVKENRVTVVTDLAQAVVEKSPKKVFEATNEKGKVEYRVTADSLGNGKEGMLSRFGCDINTFVNGKAAVCFTVPLGTKEADIKLMYGEALLAVKKYTELISATESERAAEIDALFAEDEAEA